MRKIDYTDPMNMYKSAPRGRGKVVKESDLKNRERWFWEKYPEQRVWIEEFVGEMKKGWITQDKRK